MRNSTLITLAAAVVALALTGGTAQASDLSPAEAQDLAADLGEARTGGTYIDAATGETVVAVTDQAAAAKVEAAGGTAEIVEHSTDELQDVKQTVDTAANVTGMAWGIDPEENKVVITVDSSVDAKELQHIKAGVAGDGDAVRIERAEGAFAPLVSGGHAITTGGSRCSLGFNVRRAGVDHFLTAGHCTNIGATWLHAGATIGSRVHSSFPGNDYGLVRYTSSIARPGNVYLYNGTYQEISIARNAVLNETVQRSGSTTGLHGGRVTGLNVTVAYPQGTVSGLIRTNVCAQPGDSGGPLFAGTAALGLTSGGSGNCSSGGTTFYQPVTEALSVYGATIY